MNIKFHRAINKKDRRLIKSVVGFVNECVPLEEQVKARYINCDRVMARVISDRDKQITDLQISRDEWRRLDYDEKAFTILHELGHIVCRRLFGWVAVQSHGREWKMIMRHLGVLKPLAGSDKPIEDEVMG